MYERRIVKNVLNVWSEQESQVVHVPESAVEMEVQMASQDAPLLALELRDSDDNVVLTVGGPAVENCVGAKFSLLVRQYQGEDISVTASGACSVLFTFRA